MRKVTKQMHPRFRNKLMKNKPEFDYFPCPNCESPHAYMYGGYNYANDKYEFNVACAACDYEMEKKSIHPKEEHAKREAVYMWNKLERRIEDELV